MDPPEFACFCLSLLPFQRLLSSAPKIGSGGGPTLVAGPRSFNITEPLELDLRAHSVHAFELVQSLPGGGAEETSVVDPAGVDPGLLLQRLHHLPTPHDDLSLHVVGSRAPHQT